MQSPPPIQPNPYAPQTQVAQVPQLHGSVQHQQQQQQQPVQYHPWMPTTSAPPANRRGSISRSKSFDPATGVSHSAAAATSMVSFDPYASTTTSTAAAGPPSPSAYSNYSLPPVTQQLQQPPSYFGQEAMTTSPMTQYNYNPETTTFNNNYNHNNSAASVVSEVTMFTTTAAAPATTTTLVEHHDTSESSFDPALVAEQERLWQEIQDRREMDRIRGDGGQAMPRAMIPHSSTRSSSGRTPIPRNHSMPRNAKPKSQAHSLANGGVAVLDPKKDKRKQTRKMKTSAGAVGGAVFGGLVLGPVGVVLGAGAGASVSNKVAKSRDKRKQSEFEQKNFQRGANSSVANKGDGAFV